jgi:hypothetical protein
MNVILMVRKSTLVSLTHGGGVGRARGGLRRVEPMKGIGKGGMRIDSWKHSVRRFVPIAEFCVAARSARERCRVTTVGAARKSRLECPNRPRVLVCANWQKDHQAPATTLFTPGEASSVASNGVLS